MTCKWASKTPLTHHAWNLPHLPGTCRGAASHCGKRLTWSRAAGSGRRTPAACPAAAAGAGAAGPGACSRPARPAQHGCPAPGHSSQVRSSFHQTPACGALCEVLLLWSVCGFRCSSLREQVQHGKTIFSSIESLPSKLAWPLSLQVRRCMWLITPTCADGSERKLKVPGVQASVAQAGQAGSGGS